MLKMINPQRLLLVEDEEAHADLIKKAFEGSSKKWESDEDHIKGFLYARNGEIEYKELL